MRKAIKFRGVLKGTEQQLQGYKNQVIRGTRHFFFHGQTSSVRLLSNTMKRHEKASSLYMSPLHQGWCCLSCLHPCLWAASCPYRRLQPCPALLPSLCGFLPATHIKLNVSFALPLPILVLSRSGAFLLIPSILITCNRSTARFIPSPTSKHFLLPHRLVVSFPNFSLHTTVLSSLLYLLGETHLLKPLRYTWN